MKIRLVISVLVIAGSAAQAFAGMRCGTHLVREGFTFDRVEQLCGEADAVYPMGEKYVQHVVKNPRQEAAITEVIRVDMWIYRGTPNTFARKLTFENGILVKIELGDQEK